ncbi:MAG: hypothetical protein ABI823_09590 [Bryobacteraceae bacterium]
MHKSLFTLLALPLAAVSLLAQEKPAEPPAPPPMTPIEAEFQKSMENVILDGAFTADATGTLHKDKYTIDGITKVKDDLWKVAARIQYNGKDVKFAMNVPVKWAGDTPMIYMTNFGVPMMGAFTVRLLIYKDEYAGTWRGSPTHGGIMFGKIIKQPAADVAATAPKN